MEPKEKIVNIPNIMSFYRLASFPFVLCLVYFDYEQLFALFISINLVTDILDGWIARKFNMQTALGARLDSLADIGTYLLSLAGVYRFKLHIIGTDVWILWLTVALFLIGYLVSFVKFRQFQSLHLISTKISGYVLGIFFFVLFVFTYNAWLFYIAMALASLAFLEEIIVLFVISELQSNVRSLVWLRRNNKTGI